MKIERYLNGGSEFVSTYWHEIKVLIYTAFVFLNINVDLVKILSWLMIADTLLGIAKSIRVKKLKFDFNTLLWGIVSKATLLLIPMILALVAMALGYDFKWLVDVVLKILIVSEAISSITNIASIKEKRNIENTDYISKLLHLIRDFFNKKIEFLFDNLSNKKGDKNTSNFKD